MTTRWAILGPGRMAAIVVPEFRLVPDAELVAVASRSQERADAFAAEHGILRSHGSLEALLADDEVDAVYVATPHGVHVEECLAIAAAGKHLLVEKSMATTPEGTQAIVDAARGYSHEIAHACEQIAAGRTESDVMPLDASLAVSRTLAAALAQLA